MTLIISNKHPFIVTYNFILQILDHFRMGMNNKAAALKMLVDTLREMKLSKDAEYVIMMTGAW
jgi:hypothetical protein